MGEMRGMEDETEGNSIDLAGYGDGKCRFLDCINAWTDYLID